jgi:hypothetical protein
LQSRAFTAIEEVGTNAARPRGSVDIRVIISACRLEKLSDDHLYIQRYTAEGK